MPPTGLLGISSEKAESIQKHSNSTDLFKAVRITFQMHMHWKEIVDETHISNLAVYCYCCHFETFYISVETVAFGDC